MDWKKALVAWKFKLAGEEQAAARYQYQDALAEAWGRTLYGGITRWCREHGVQSIGHFLEHGNVYLHPDLCAGNMFQLQKYSDMGGIDAVFDQFSLGPARGPRRTRAGRRPSWAAPITHAYGKPDDVTMVEIFGARGQDLTYPEMKWWTDHMQVSGVNFLIPHSFNPRAPRDTDCPPYFYNGGFEPRWPLYRVFADYTSRLSVMLTGGRHVCPVALLFLGSSAHVGKRVLPDQISEALQDALYDCDWLPYEVFENDMQLGGQGTASSAQESYRVLVVPPVEVIPYATLAKAKEFFDGGRRGGRLRLPARQVGHAGQDRRPTSPSCARRSGARRSPGLAVCKTSAGRRAFLPAAGEADAGAAAAGAGRRRRASIRRSKSSKARPTTGCTCCTASRPAATCSSSPTRTTSASRGSSGSASRPQASRNAGTRCATRSRPCRTSAAASRRNSR